MSQKTYLLISIVLSMVFSGLALGWTPIDEWEYNLGFEYNIEGEQMICSTRVSCGDWYDPNVGGYDPNSNEGWEPNEGTLCGVMAWRENQVDWPLVEIQCHDPILGSGDDCACKDAGWSVTEGSMDLTMGQWGEDANMIVWQTLDPAYDSNVIIKPDHEYRVTFDSFRWQGNDLKFHFFYGDIAESNSVDLDVNTIAEFVIDVGTEPFDTVTCSFKAEGGEPYIGEPLGLRFYQRGQGWHWIDDVRIDYRVLAFAREPNPEHDAKYVSQDVSLSWVPGSYAASHEVYFGTDWDGVNNANRFDTTNIFRGDYDANSYAIPEIPLELGQVYYWRVDEVNEGYFPGPIPVPPDHRWKGPIWKFRIEGPADNPIPADGAVEQSIYSILKWEPGTGSDTHDVYLGTDASALACMSTAQGPNSYDPGMLDLGQTYYWRIDERNDAEGRLINGYVWSFTTAPHYVIDDIESYDLGLNLITDTWVDWYENDSTAEILLETDVNYIQSGQSMRYIFENSEDPHYAETSREFSPAQDWTAAGFKVLALDFKADMTNEADAVQPMSVFISDGVYTGTVEYDDPNDLIRGWVGWQEWNIDLQAFVEDEPLLDLSSISSMGIVIGVEDVPSGDGDVYIDDIRLYPTRCVVEEAAGSFTNDCDIDIYDLAVLARDWLVSGIGSITASPPSVTGLHGHWAMDDNAATSVVLDNSLNGNNGVLYDDVTGDGSPKEGDTDDHSVAGVNDLALEFDGLDDYVELPAMNISSNAITLAAWVKRDPQVPGHAYDGIVMSSNAWVPEGETAPDPNYTAGLQFGSDPTDWSANYELSFMWTGYSWEWRTGLHVPPNQWAFTALTVAPDVATIYLHDGITMQAVRKYDTYEPLPWSTAFHVADQMQFGPPSSDSERFFPGVVDDVWIYNRTLLPEEILSLAGMGSADIALELWCADADGDNDVDLQDYAMMADNWLGEVLWP
jgi:hypothetical protein